MIQSHRCVRACVVLGSRTLIERLYRVREVGMSVPNCGGRGKFPVVKGRFVSLVVLIDDSWQRTLHR